MIAGVVSQALWGQLSDAGTGVNPRLVALASSYTFDPFQFDFSATSVNFLFGTLDPSALQETSVFTFPFLTIDLLGAQDQREVKFSTFSGPIMGVVEVHHSWPDESVIADFGALVNATGDAVITCLNDAASQDWPPTLQWNGKASMQPGPLKLGGLGWLKSTRFVCPFKFTI